MVLSFSKITLLKKPCASHRIKSVLLLAALVVGLVSSTTVHSEESNILEKVTKPSQISPDEKMVDEFSLRKAVDYLDNAALDWQQRNRCVSCHTNGLFLASRAEIAPADPPNTLVRDYTRNYLEKYAIDKEPAKGDRGAIQGIVSSAAFLVISDVKTTGKLDPITKSAFDFVWAHQNDQGFWDEWLKCNWPPFEVDDHFGVTLVAYAVGMSYDELAQSPEAQEGIERLRNYLQDHSPENLHQSAMLLLASTTWEEVLSADGQQRTIVELFSTQRPDGGWNLLNLGDWERSDGKAQDTSTSDGYATGFVTYVLRKAGVDADDPRISKAIDWLKQNQRVSGRWYTRSPRRDGKHYISNAGTSYAVMALAACGESVTLTDASK